MLVLSEWRDGGLTFGQNLASQLINVVFFAVIVYFNILYLFPKYLRRAQYLSYVAMLALAALIITPLKLGLKYILFAGDGGMRREILEDLSSYFVSMFLVAAFSTVGKIMVDWITENRKKQKVRNESMQSELRFLKSQINPHFLFNTLNSLYALTLKKDDKAPDIVIKLSEMMRYMLYECNEPKVPLSKEINYLRNYLDLERLRQRKGIDIQLKVTGEVSDQQLAPLLFIPFLENSFKHGVNSGIQDGFVHAGIDVDGPHVRFSLENSKGELMPGRALHAGKPSGGIGLVNVRRRLELLYPGRYELEVRESPTTYNVQLDLRLGPSPGLNLPPPHALSQRHASTPQSLRS